MTSHALTQSGAVALTASSEGLRLSSPYDAAFVAAFKLAIPPNARRWDGARKQWLIDPSQGAALVSLVNTFYGVSLTLPTSAPIAQPTVEVVQLAYLGACKTRDDGSATASGYTLGNRQPKSPDLVMPESVLKAWFDGMSMGTDSPTPQKAAPANTLYSVLCITQDADMAALKAAYRRMARQTHPDVNKEPDADAAFRRVQAAYDVLGDTLKRKKYDAGLMLEARAKGTDQPTEAERLAAIRAKLGFSSYQDNYRAPLRCGLLLVTGIKRLGRIEVSKIMSWQDLSRNGKVLVSSWPQDAQVWEESWVTP